MLHSTSGLINFVVREIPGNFGLHAGNMKSNTKKEERISSLSWDVTQRRLAVTDVSGRTLKIGPICCPKNQLLKTNGCCLRSH
jgi:hypothetical protein